MHRLKGPGNFRHLAAHLAKAFLLLIGPERGLALAEAAREEAPREWSVGPLRPPARWELVPTDRLAYPQLLAQAIRTQGAGPGAPRSGPNAGLNDRNDRSMMTLIGKRLAPGTKVQRFAMTSAAPLASGPLRNIRWQIQAIDGWGGYRVQLDATLDAPARVVRQFFYVCGAIGYVLTLIAPQPQAIPRLRDLEDTVSSLSCVPPAPAPVHAPSSPLTPDGGVAPPDGGGGAAPPAPSP